MADIYKCTKISVGLTPGAGSGEVGVKADFYDPTTTPPTPGTITLSTARANAEDETALRTAIDSALAAASLNPMDWSL